MIISVACLLTRCLLGCLAVLTRHQASKDAELLVFLWGARSLHAL
jgi:hypothetical protein